MMTPARTHDFHRAPREENCPVTSGHSGSSVLIDQKRRLFFLKEKSEKKRKAEKVQVRAHPYGNTQGEINACDYPGAFASTNNRHGYLSMEVLFKHASCRIKPKANKVCLSPLLFSLIRLCLQDRLPPKAEDLMALFEEGALEACGEPCPAVQRSRGCIRISLRGTSKNKNSSIET